MGGRAGVVWRAICTRAVCAGVLFFGLVVDARSGAVALFPEMFLTSEE